MYAITNAYEIRDSLKAAGATFDAARKAWMVNDATFAKLQARSRTYGMGWAQGWAKAVKTQIAAPTAAPDWQNDPQYGYAE